MHPGGVRDGGRAAGTELAGAFVGPVSGESLSSSATNGVHHGGGLSGGRLGSVVGRGERALLFPLRWGRSLDGRTVRKAVHGIDLGALKPCLPQRLFTKNKRIVLAPEILVQDLKRVKTHFFEKNIATDATWNLLLIGRRHLRSNNSWMHNSHRLVKGKNRCTLLMNTQDALARGLSNGHPTLSNHLDFRFTPGIDPVPG